jgi:hypothetical protein
LNGLSEWVERYRAPAFYGHGLKNGEQSKKSCGMSMKPVHMTSAVPTHMPL